MIENKMNENDLNELLKSLAKLMLDKGQKLAVAESCTGGLIAASITELPGSSRWFDRGFVTYSNEAKQDMLGVDKALIQKHGAVSEPVACAMAEGALKASDADVSLSVTGIAGPDGGSPEKPVGTVHFAWSASWLPQTKHLHQLFSGNRHDIRKKTVYFALQTLNNLLKAHK